MKRVKVTLPLPSSGLSGRVEYWPILSAKEHRTELRSFLLLPGDIPVRVALSYVDSETGAAHYQRGLCTDGMTLEEVLSAIDRGHLEDRWSSVAELEAGFHTLHCSHCDGEILETTLARKDLCVSCAGRDRIFRTEHEIESVLGGMELAHRHGLECSIEFKEARDCLLRALGHLRSMKGWYPIREVSDD
jgi:hypothetical protein